MAGLGGRLGQAGPEQRGFWSVGSRQPSAASSGARSEDGLEAPSLCLPFCHVPQSSGGRPRPSDHTGGAALAGDSFLLLKEWQAEAALGTHARLAAEWKRILGPTFSNPSFCGSSGTQRFP